MMPETLDEAVHDILAELEEQSLLELFAQVPENRMIALTHHSIGRDMRNAFGLWDKDSLLMRNMGVEDADEASGIILKAAWTEARAGNAVIIEQESQDDC